MFKWWLRLAIAGVFSVLWVQSVDAQKVEGLQVQGNRGVETGENSVNTTSNLIAQGITRVTGVEVKQTDSGLEVILTTAAGSERLVPLILPEGKDLVIDILDATLASSIKDGVEELNPAPGITKVTVNTIDENSIQIRITGEQQAPNAEVVTGRDDLVLSIISQGTTAQQTPDEEIEIIATGEGEENYYVPDASTATRTDTPIRDIPQSIQVVPQEVLRDRNVRSLTEAVETVSGVVDGGNLAGSSASSRIIRGFQQAGNFRNGYRDAPNTYILSSPINTIEQVEILKGPASVLFGDLEPGGIVNIVTRQPLSEPFYQLEFQAGNRNFYQPSLDFSGPLTTNRDLLYRFIAAYQTKEDIQDFVDINQSTIAPSLTWQIGEKTNLNLYYEYNNFVAEPPSSSGILLSDNSLTPRDLYTSYPNLNDSDQSANRFGYTITHEFNDNWQIRNNFAGLISNVKETQVYATAIEEDRFATIEAYDLDYGYDNYFVQLDVVGEFKTGSVDHQVVVGFDFNDFTDDYIGFFNTDLPILDLQNPNYDIPEPIYEPFFEFENKVQSYGLYLQDQIALGKSFKLLIGGQYDWVSSSLATIDLSGAGDPTEDSANDGAFSPRIGLVYQPSDTISLYTSYTRSFRAQSGFASTPVGFDPTRGTQYEVGVKADWLDSRLSTTLAAYHLTKTNVITSDPNNPLIQKGIKRSPVTATMFI
jgi:iron complex outermembrane receptor protein